MKKAVSEDLKNKMVFIGGARQVGKTTLALQIAPKSRRYLNWDILEDREFLLQQKFPLENFIVFDEIHKFKQWRNYIKGLYDRHRAKKRILLTGSARLDYYRRSGDSLQGRYHYYRLNPLTVKELGIQSQQDMLSLLTLGGFPEPFLSGSERQASRWQRERKSRVIYEDISSLEMSQNLSQMELLLSRLPELVSAPLSINSLRKDLQTAHKTVSKYLNIFERMYLIYRLPPFGSPRLRAVKKEQKHYHYNWAEVKAPGPRFENLVAGHLLKWVHFQQDYKGRDTELCYFRDTDKREVDFIVTENGYPLQAVECRLKSRGISPHLVYFKNRFPKTKCAQVHLKSQNEYESREGVRSLHWKSFLKELI